jgi:deoxyhypusine synthase
MNVAAMELQGGKLRLNPSADVNETAAIVLAAKRGGGKSAIFICGGGSPKNFALQTEPQIQEVLGIDEKGHDYFLQVDGCAARHRRAERRDAGRGGQLGQDRSEKLPGTVVCYLDTTVALPLITAYGIASTSRGR